MGLKKKKCKTALSEKKELIALHPELRTLQQKIDRALRSTGLDRTKRLDVVRKVLRSEQPLFDSESQNVTKLLDLLNTTTDKTVGTIINLTDDAYSFDPALKLVSLNLIEESQRNSKMNAQMLKFLKGYLEYCQQHEKVSN